MSASRSRVQNFINDLVPGKDVVDSLESGFAKANRHKLVLFTHAPFTVTDTYSVVSMTMDIAEQKQLAELT